MEDFGEGLIASTSFDGEQICLPYLISTQVMYYNKDMAAAEGIEMPKTVADMDAFLEKATLFNEDGTTKRYGTVFGGWDYWYYEMLYKNNGVQLVLEDGTTDINSEKSVEITNKIKEWIDKGYAYYAYGTGASSDMRQLFWDGGAFSVFHTSSLYDTYVNKVKESANPFEVGMAWSPGSEDGTIFKSEVGGSVILIPASATQAEKNAAWQFLMFMTSPEINLYWADKTGDFPTRASVQGTPEYQDYLCRRIREAKDFAEDDEILIFLSSNDKELLDSLTARTGCPLQVSSENFLGGIRAEIPAKNILIRIFAISNKFIV